MPDLTTTALIAAGLAVSAVATTVWGRRARRSRRRTAAEARLAQHFEAQLRQAADIAISHRRRTASPDERVPVLVQDVLEKLHEHFGIVAVPRERAAAMLRRRYELRTCSFDCTTDAYDDIEGTSRDHH